MFGRDVNDGLEPDLGFLNAGVQKWIQDFTKQGARTVTAAAGVATLPAFSLLPAAAPPSPPSPPPTTVLGMRGAPEPLQPSSVGAKLRPGQKQ